jgi:hypothetical protein
LGLFPFSNSCQPGYPLPHTQTILIPNANDHPFIHHTKIGVAAPNNQPSVSQGFWAHHPPKKGWLHRLDATPAFSFLFFPFPSKNAQSATIFPINGLLPSSFVGFFPRFASSLKKGGICVLQICFPSPPVGMLFVPTHPLIFVLLSSLPQEEEGVECR